MPKFFKQNLLSKQPELDPTHELEAPLELESPLDTPELTQPQPEAVPPQQQSQVLNNPPTQKNDEEEQDYGYYGRDPVKELVTWEALSRPFRKKDRSFYTTIAILFILISLIVILAGEKILLGALLAFAFLIYVLNFVEPQKIRYKLSTQGVTIEQHFYHWQELDSFWFSEKDGFKILHILTQFGFPAVLLMVLGDKDEESVKKIVAKFLPFHEIAPKSTLDKWAESLQKNFPLENPHR